MTNQSLVSSRVSAAEATAASTKEASEGGTDISADTPVLLLTNLGTLKTPTTKDVRRYLRGFPSDQHIIEMPRSVWKLILKGVTLRVCPTQSTEKYRSAWLEEGPLLLHYMTQQAKLLTDRLGIRVVPAIQYGEPTPGDVLDKLMAAGYHRVDTLSAYLQYSATTITSVNDAVCVWMQENHDRPRIRFSRSFPNDPYYIETLVGAIEDFWGQNGRPDFEGSNHALLSYHSIPVSMHRTGDPHHSECLATTEVAYERLGLSAQERAIAFQSVLGPSEWLKPATINTVEDLVKTGTGCVDVIHLGFISDCSKTFKEVDQLNRGIFLEVGGSEFHCVLQGNDVGRVVDTLEVQACVLLSGWAEQGMYEDEAAG